MTDIFFLQDDDPQTEYYRRTCDDKKGVAWGQLKLMISEVWFLTEYWLKSKRRSENPIIVYAGAADGRHIGLLSSQFFPEAEFHLYDSRPFKVKASEKVHLYHRYFEMVDAQRWADHQKRHGNVYLISDIRTADYKIMEERQNEAAIDSDNHKQQEWHQTINPVASLLKFRPHYAYPFLPKTYRYLKGKLFKQAWAPQTSTECRLVPDPSNEEIDYDVEKYGNQMFHHNTVIREKHTFPNPFDGTSNPIDPPNLINDFDSTSHIIVLKEYLSTRTGKSVKSEEVLHLSRCLLCSLTEHLSPEDKFTLAQLRNGIIVPGSSKPIRSVSQLMTARLKSRGHDINNSHNVMSEGDDE
jgi:hypothetical protein